MKLIFVDFDGVVVNTFEVAHKIVTELDSTPPSKETYRRYFDGNIYDAYDEGLPQRISDDDPFFVRFGPAILQLRPVAGMKQVLERLSQTASLVIMSSTIGSIIKKYLAAYGMLEVFTDIYGGDRGASKVAKMQEALQRFDCKPEEALMITDTLGDIRETNEVGVPAVAVTWGYHQTADLKKGSPKAIASTPEELLAILERL